MKKGLLAFGQFVVFLAVNALGSFLQPFKLRWAEATSPVGVSTSFVPDGLLLTVGLFLAIVIVQAIRKRTSNTPWTVVSFLLAIGVGYATRLGFITKDI